MAFSKDAARPYGALVLGSVCLWAPESMVLDASVSLDAGGSLLTAVYPWFLICASLAVAGVIAFQHGAYRATHGVVGVAACVYAAGGCLTLVGSMVSQGVLAGTSLDGAWLVFAGSMLAGLGFGPFMMAWGLHYIDLPLRAIKTGIALVAVVQAVLMILSPWELVRLFLVVIMPPVSYVLLRRSVSGLALFGREEPRLSYRSYALRPNFVAGVAVISLGFGVLNGILSALTFESTVLSGVLSSLVIALAVASVLFSKDSSGYATAWRLIVFAMIGGFAALLVVSSGGTGIAVAVVSVGYGVFEYILWIASVDLAKYSSDPLRFIAVTFVLTIGGQGTGFLVAQGAHALMGADAYALLVVASLLAFAAAIIWLLPTDAILHLFAGESKRTTAPSPIVSSESIREALKREFGLTEREAEVAQLLSSGRSARYIQEELTISEGTAWTHIRHIYQKMNVGSRQEFLTAVESMALDK